MSQRIFSFKVCILISVCMHALTFLTVFYQKSQAVSQVPVSVVFREVKITARSVGRKSDTNLNRFLPNPFTSSGRAESSKLDSATEIAKALEEMAEGNPFKKKEHRFYSYYERIKQEVEPLWISGVRDLVVTARRQRTKWRASGGKVATVVTIIDKNGTIVQVLLVKSSGDPKLDSLALLLMRGRQYPNPPKDLIEGDGFGRLVWFYRT
jgi:hypothetical protein